MSQTDGKRVKQFRSGSTVWSIWSTILYAYDYIIYAHILLLFYVTCDENEGSVLFCSGYMNLKIDFKVSQTVTLNLNLDLFI